MIATWLVVLLETTETLPDRGSDPFVPGATSWHDCEQILGRIDDADHSGAMTVEEL